MGREVEGEVERIEKVWISMYNVTTTKNRC